MPSAPDALAQRLADHFAPELGAALTPLTERLLAGKPTEEADPRSDEPSVLLAHARYLIGLAALALDVHRRVLLTLDPKAQESKLAILGRTLDALREEAPQASQIPDHLRRRMIATVTDFLVGRDRLIPHAELVVLHRAAVSSGFCKRRDVLAGIDKTFVARLPLAPTRSDQHLSDLDAMNAEGALPDGSVPLAIWIDNAWSLTWSLREAMVFAMASGQLKEHLRARP